MECWARSEASALLWNDGFKKNKTQIMALFLSFWWCALMGRNRKQLFGFDHTECRSSIFCRIGVFRFPYPVFQHSTIPYDRKKHRKSNRLYNFRDVNYAIILYVSLRSWFFLFTGTFRNGFLTRCADPTCFCGIYQSGIIHLFYPSISLNI